MENHFGDNTFFVFLFREQALSPVISRKDKVYLVLFIDYFSYGINSQGR